MIKENLSRDEVIICRLKNMTRMAIELRELEKNGEIKKLAEKDEYIRIRGESYRAVSLSDKTPLCGYAKRGVKTIKTIISHFEKKPKMKEKELKKREERRIQSWLIKNALKNNRNLNKALGIPNKALGIPIFDEFLFALDEVSLGDKSHPQIIRCDILAVGSKNDNVFPVLIELKSGRKKKDLENQLVDFSKEIKGEVREKFVELLEACTGKNINKDEEICKVIIWPKNTNENPKTSRELKEKKILVIGYELKEKCNINSIEFSI